MAQERVIVVEGELGALSYRFNSDTDAETYMRVAIDKQFALIPAGSDMTSIGPNSQRAKTKADRYIPIGKLLAVQ